MSLSLEWGGGWTGALAALALAAAMIWHGRRTPARGVLLALRVLAAAALAVALLQPTVAVSEPQLFKPRLLVLVDNGHPMAAPARIGGLPLLRSASRLRAALDWLRGQRRSLEVRCQPEFYALSDRGRRLAGWSELDGLSVSAAGLRPAAALRDAADEQGPESRPERAWLLSDGNAESDPELERALAELRLPVDVVGVGPSQRERGVAFVDLKTPDFAFLHGRVSVEAAVEASALSGRVLELSLLKRSAVDRQRWETVERRESLIRTDLETVVATFTATAESLGSESYRVAARAGSAQGARDFRMEVIRQKYRIMYLAGRPSAEYANLREFLKSNPNHELVSFVILRNPENPTLVPDNELSLIPFPAPEIFVQTISQFDLFILENFSYERFRAQIPLAYLDSLRSFVAAGGALLVIGGENAFSLGGYRGTPLEEVLPVKLSSRVPDFIGGLFRAKPVALSHPLVQLYDTPEQSRAAWEALPELDGYGQFVAARPGAAVLAAHPRARTDEGEPVPIFAIRDYGRGKVMLVSSDSTWRWRLGGALDWRTANFYGRFWTRAVQYLTGSLELSKVKFAPLPDRLPSREPAVVALRVFDEGFAPAAAAATELKVLWTAPDGTVREVVPRETGPGAYAVEMTGLAPGWNRLKAMARYQGKAWGEDEARFEWAQTPPEAPMDRKWLRRVAEATGGTFSELSAADAAALLEKLSPVRRQSEIVRRRRLCTSLWWLTAALALLLCEWAARRWRGHP
ncbi:MAG: glutamine amidotransferase [Elusimicrobia bacterium]|nr:glutamine amidotransferase [Elusimicrobiota bacterium]